MRNKVGLEVGQKIQTQTGEIEVLNVDRQNITVRFDDGYETVALKTNVLKGNVRNPNFKSYFGVGYRGAGSHTMHGKLSYNKWHNMLVRCYDEEYKSQHPTYEGVHCCLEWHNYQNFTDWFHKQVGCGEKGFELDKDLLFKGNEIYSPETCILVPQELNKILGNTGIDRGISTRPDLNGKWMIRCNTVHGEIYLGCHPRVAAIKIYQDFKLNYIKERAEFWKDRVDSKVYEALMNFTF